MDTAQDQLNEIKNRQLEADIETLGNPNGFIAPYFIALFFAIAAGDLPNGWNLAVASLAVVSLIGLCVWKVRSRRAAPSKRYHKAIVAPTIIFAFVVAAVLFAMRFTLDRFDTPYSATISAFVFCVMCYFGFKIMDKIAVGRIKKAF